MNVGDSRVVQGGSDREPSGRMATTSRLGRGSADPLLRPMYQKKFPPGKPWAKPMTAAARTRCKH